MYRKIIRCCFLVGIMAGPINLSAEEQVLNTVGCMIVNDGFLKNEPELLAASPVSLSMDTSQLAQIYHHKNLTVSIGAASVIQAAMRQGWISSFKLVVIQPGHDSIKVQSAPRSNPAAAMNTHLAVSRDGKTETGELIIECNAR
ncbi:hypothetical protein [Thalassomonas sp. RHCl1]|uniref:hypothetical protein n=1 Tax=Thalassomonas sp. RHCl1 TaxID=2995320 RepID=UPI00248BAF93|nr:hypothetical protein [Thalassomonas sp. RHCl1]